MTDAVLLVDLENLPLPDVEQLPPHVQVRVFAGANQGRVPLELVQQTQPLGDRLEWIRISKSGKNALDLCIACYLGEHLAKRPETHFFIMSKDTGFDALIANVVGRGIHCRRITDVADLHHESKPRLSDRAQRVRHALASTEKNKRPRKRETLANWIATHLNKDLSAGGAPVIVDELVTAGLITLSDEALSYHF